jgi:hypothetical protein
MNNKNILKNIQKELKENIDEHTKETAQKFFKEKIKVYGIKTVIVGKISNVLGYSSGSNEEKLQNGFIANNLNNRTIGVGGRKSPLRPPLCRTRRSYKKAKKYTRRV